MRLWTVLFFDVEIECACRMKRIEHAWLIMMTCVDEHIVGIHDDSFDDIVIVVIGNDDDECM